MRPFLLFKTEKHKTGQKTQLTCIMHYNRQLSLKKFLGPVHIFTQEFTNHASFGHQGNIPTASMPI